jgi:hypothetical protein
MSGKPEVRHSWSGSYVRQVTPSVNKRTDLNDELAELDIKAACDQAQYWNALVKEYPNTDTLKGLPPDNIVNDVVTRFFDSSDKCLDLVFDLCYRDQDPTFKTGGDDKASWKLSKGGLLDALADHCGLLPESLLDMSIDEAEEKSEAFREIARIVHIPIPRADFKYAIRRLRLAVLLQYHGLGTDHFALGGLAQSLYHMDYDDDHVFTEYHFIKHKVKLPRTVNGHLYRIPRVEKQVAIQPAEYAEYFYTNKQSRRGSVHWVHIQYPSSEILLALGQTYRMPGRIQVALRGLRVAHPQLWVSSYLLKQKVHIERHKQIGGEPQYDWSFLVSPGIGLEKKSILSLEKFDIWFRKRQTTHMRDSTSEEPPRIRVALVEFNLAMVWSDPSTKTLVSMCGVPKHLGSWITDAKVQPTFWKQLKDRICCRRHKEPGTPKTDKDGYQPVPQVDEDERDLEDSFVELEMEFEIDKPSADDTTIADLGGEEQCCCSYEHIFEKTILALEGANSLLRTGDNLQLMTRVLLNQSQKYLQVASLYNAAIHRLRWLLQKADTKNKDVIIQKVETAKRELAMLERMVKPYYEDVVPILVDGITSNFHDSVSEHQAKEMAMNMNSFMPKLTACIEACDALATQYDRDASDKMNSVLNILTFITFVITPMQLMTGLYGMNFTYKDQPNMPELRWKYGYAYFWAMSTSLSVLFAVVLLYMTRET